MPVSTPPGMTTATATLGLRSSKSSPSVNSLTAAFARAAAVGLAHRLGQRLGQRLDGSPVGEVDDVGAQRSVDAVVASSAVPSSPARPRSTAATQPPRASSASTTSRPIPVPPAGDHEHVLAELHG